MTEEDIKRIEGKVDLLYKILLELSADEYGNFNTHKVINNFMDELIPLFELSATKINIDQTSFQIETLQELESKLKTELSRLEKIYESGDFLAKDKDKIRSKIGDITYYLRDWYSNRVERKDSILSLREWVISDYNDIIKTNLFLDLKKKLGLPCESSIIKELIKGLNSIKKEFKALFKKLSDLGETKI